MDLPVMPPVSPMLAKLTRELPPGEGMLFEPKWDGFRCIVFRDGSEVELGSRNERPITRYFPELLDPLRDQLPEKCVLDGEVVIAGPEGRLDFDALLQRIHPAESRVRLLAQQTPASFVAFDVLAVGDEDLRPAPQSERRQ
ncbi:MAG: ATP-dependent DNA ligase, partial [bacterium]